jgi:hypothetical protein
MGISRFVAGLRRAGPPRYIPPHAEERPGDDPGGSVIAAWAVFLALFLVLLAATVIDGMVHVGGTSGDPEASLGGSTATPGPDNFGGERSDGRRASLPLSPTR